MRRAPEAAIQKAIVTYLRLVVPDGLVFAVPNAARRTANGFAGNGVPGLTKGIPDLALVMPGGRLFFIECKAPKGRLTLDQEAIRSRCIRHAIPFMVATSVEDVRVALAAWGVDTREHEAAA